MSEHNQLKLLIATTTNDSLQYTLHYLYGRITDPECEKAIILSVNNLLTSSKSRFLGLEFVKALIPYCSLSAISENSLHWCNNCVVHEDDSLHKEVKLGALVEIMKHANSVESFHKKFSADYLASTMKACLKFHNNQEKITCLKCLSLCMAKYPNWFGNHKPKVEQLLISCLENPNENAIQHAAFAFLCFLQTGSAGVGGANYVKNFSLHFKKLCATVHTLYDQFFEGIFEIDDSLRIEEKPFQFTTKIYNSSAEKNVEVTAYRILNCIAFLKTMISKRFCAEKQVTPKHVLDVVNRGLSVHVCSTKSPNYVEKRNQAWLLNKIQNELFQLLKIFVIRYHANILPFAYIIKSIFLNSLRKTQNFSCNCFNISFKTRLYKTLAVWLSLNDCLIEPHFYEVVIPIILKEITPFKKNVVLNISVKKNSKSNQNQATATSHNINDRDLSAIEISAKEIMCVYSLETLKWLLATSTSKVDSNLLQETFNLTVKTLTELQYSEVVPYKNPRCQVKLYQALLAFCRRNDTYVTSSLHLIINLFSKGLNSSNCDITKVANEGLQLLENISQPVCKSLNIPDSNYLFQRTDPDDLMNVVHEEMTISSHTEQSDSNELLRQNDPDDLAQVVHEEMTTTYHTEPSAANDLFRRSDPDDLMEVVHEEMTDSCHTEQFDNDETQTTEEAELEDASGTIIPETHSVEAVVADVVIEEQPQLDKEDTRDSFEDMCLSFQDVVQD